jgi:hypothetical protein
MPPQRVQPLRDLLTGTSPADAGLTSTDRKIWSYYYYGVRPQKMGGAGEKPNKVMYHIHAAILHASNHVPTGLHVSHEERWPLGKVQSIGLPRRSPIKGICHDPRPYATTRAVAL